MKLRSNTHGCELIMSFRSISRNVRFKLVVNFADKEIWIEPEQTDILGSYFIRYNIPLPRMPSICSCSSRFTIEHALSCKKGGFISIHHNEVRDFTCYYQGTLKIESSLLLLKETCSDVSIETPLQRITNETFQLKTHQM